MLRRLAERSDTGGVFTLATVYASYCLLVWAPASGYHESVRVFLVLGIALSSAACQVLFDPPAGSRSGDDAPSEAQQVHVPSFETSSPAFVPVPDAQLSFTPATDEEVWLVLVSAVLGSSTVEPSADETVEARYTINGTPRGLGGSLNSVAHAGGPWQHFDVVTGTTERQTVRVELRDVPGSEASITDLRVLAVPLPEGADPHFVRQDATSTVDTTSWRTELSFDFTPESMGTYLVLGLVNANEKPGNDAFVRWQLTDGTLVPDFRYQNPRFTWQSFLLAQSASLDAAPQHMELQTSVGTDAMSIQYARLLAFRVDAFEGFWADYLGSGGDWDAPQTVASVEVDAPPSPADHLIVMSARVDTGCPAPDSATRGASFDLGADTLMSFAHVHDNCAYRATYGPFALQRTNEAFRLETRIMPAEVTVRAREVGIYALRLP